MYLSLTSLIPPIFETLFADNFMLNSVVYYPYKLEETKRIPLL